MAANPKRWEQPDSLSDAIDMLADLRETVEELERQVESVGDDATMWEEKCDDAEGRAVDAEYALEAQATNIACALMLIKRGRIDEAKDALDRILQEVDPDCKARMSAVILPAQASLL